MTTSPLTPRQAALVGRLQLGQVLRRPRGWRAFLFHEPQGETPVATPRVGSYEVIRLLARGLVNLHDSRTGDPVFVVPPHLNGAHLEVRLKHAEVATGGRR